MNNGENMATYSIIDILARVAVVVIISALLWQFMKKK
jgi:hypothetical protein